MSPPESLKILITNRKERAYVKNQAIFNILDSMKEKVDVKDIWILMDSGKNLSNYGTPLKYNYKFFEEYKTENVVEILKKERPDFLFCLNDYDFFGRSFIIAAKHLGIPTVLSLQGGFLEVAMDKKEFSIVRGRFSILKQRGSFIFKKYRLLLKTYKQVGYNLAKILKKMVWDFVDPFLDREPAGKYGCDIILVINKKTENILKKRGIKSKIVVTGDPASDTLFERISDGKIRQENSSESLTKVVLVTTGVVEHGDWTKKMWQETIEQIVFQLCKDSESKMDFLIKIHPVTEVKENYLNLLKKIGYDVPVLQTENLTDVLSNCDVVISYGMGSWGIMEAVLIEKPVIIVNLFRRPKEKSPYIQDGVAFEVNNIGDLKKIIPTVKSKKINRDVIDNFISKNLFKFDGKASERTRDAILDLVKHHQEKQV